MNFRTIVDIAKLGFEIEPCERMLFVGSCFADSIGQRFVDEKFHATVNPYGVMYNPASVLHTVERFCYGQALTEAGSSAHGQALTEAESRNKTAKADAFPVKADAFPRVVFITLGTNHVYRLKATGEIVDNCQKRPQTLFLEQELTVAECAHYLSRAIEVLRSQRPDVCVVFTVSPIRYRKYGYHESQLSKATLLLAVKQTIDTYHSEPSPLKTAYFPAYEIVLDELRDYRFYTADMLHPSAQAVDYIWEQLVDACFSARAKQFLKEWAPLKAALGHRPFNAESDEYRQFLEKTMLKVAELQKKYLNFAG